MWVKSSRKRWPVKLLIPMKGITVADYMGRIVMRWSDRGNQNGGVDAWICICSRRCSCSCRRSVSVKRAGFHVMGPWSGSLEELFVALDWQLRVFWLSGIINIPSDHIYACTIPLYRCMERRSYYTLSYYKKLLFEVIVNNVPMIQVTNYWFRRLEKVIQLII